jgi:hypothetical protein
LPWGLLATAALTLLLSLHPFAAWAARAVPAFDALQFAWRFLAVASACLAAAAGFAVARAARWLAGHRAAALVPAAAVVLLIADAAPFTGAAAWLPAYDGFGHLRRARDCAAETGCWEHVPLADPVPLRVAGLFVPPPRADTDVGLFWWAYPEFATPAIQRRFLATITPRRLAAAGVGALALQGRPLRRLRAAPYARWLAEPPGEAPAPRPFVRGGGEIRVGHDGRAGRIEVLEQYFPGWQVLTDGGWQEVRPTAQGLLQAQVRRGQREVRFRFHEWRWDRTLGWALSAVGLASIAAMAFGSRPARSPPAPPPD